MDKLPIVLDLTGTFVFALSGALAGARRQLDLFGVLVLSFAAGNSGGITRDLLIGAVPPGAVGDWRYLGVSLLGRLDYWHGTEANAVQMPAIAKHAICLSAGNGTQARIA